MVSPRSVFLPTPRNGLPNSAAAKSLFTTYRTELRGTNGQFALPGADGLLVGTPLEETQFPRFITLGTPPLIEVMRPTEFWGAFGFSRIGRQVSVAALKLLVGSQRLLSRLPDVLPTNLLCVNVYGSPLVKR